MTPSLTVRRIAAHQGAVLRELRTASLREAPYAFGETLEDALLVDAASFDEMAARQASSPAAATFLLYTEGHPAGLVGAFIDESGRGRAFVHALWVAPAVRHLRGGELLVNAASHWLAQQGAAEVYAWIADENRTAMRFYERLGFGPTGDRRSMPAHAEEWETLLVHHVQIEERRAPGAA
ncbi:Histone acetyltransferase HPA2 and related acetyltransferases [Caballeronia glathei]|jgi:GNAT superfamily N-acetyltransferase|uniref:GCN5 family acetyltransferase n=1 Tax=Caballeronia glathei TaxID=60547 RepID=A0A069PV62_9BURK|nr:MULTISPECIES: GNAT family N-acetyltransferase [Burkholderiaceae]KDR44455.1 GCN5 family acetyltransferase [Caballeronia glathei]TCK44440.1 acetyltransferase (GNAT) family protein [Paraburkholderia sp. BL8N3]CDY74070.1 Histone acetyltransferase HPA2 and related acetyltransferases [Caballeronia glathei]